MNDVTNTREPRLSRSVDDVRTCSPMQYYLVCHLVWRFHATSYYSLW